MHTYSLYGYYSIIGPNEKYGGLKTYPSYAILGRKEGLSTNGCKEVKKDVQNVKALRQRKMENPKVSKAINV